MVAPKAPNVPTNVINQFNSKHGAVRCLSFSQDGKYCLTGGSDYALRLWNPKTGILLKTYQGHADSVSTCHCSHDNGQLISGSRDKSVILWDVSTGQSMRRYRHYAGEVACARFAGVESSVILSSGMDGKVYIWDNRSRSLPPMQVLDEAKDAVNSLCAHRWYIYTVCLDSSVRCYDMRKGCVTTDFIGKPLTRVVVTSDGQCVLLSCQDSTLRLIDSQNGDLLNTYTGHKNVKYLVDSCILHGEGHIISGSEDGCVAYWDFLTCKHGSFRLPVTDNQREVVLSCIVANPTLLEYLVASQDTVYVIGETDDGNAS